MRIELAKAAMDYCVENNVKLKVVFDTSDFQLVLPNELHAVHVKRELDQMTSEAVEQFHETLR